MMSHPEIDHMIKKIDGYFLKRMKQDSSASPR